MFFCSPGYQEYELPNDSEEKKWVAHLDKIETSSIGFSAIIIVGEVPNAFSVHNISFLVLPEWFKMSLFHKNQ